MSILSRLGVGLALIATLTLGAAAADAAFPERPIRLIVGMPPGGGADYVARLVVAKASARLGQSIVVENRAGADGVVAAQVVARAPADGYTLAWVTNSHVVAPLFHKLAYDAAASFAPVAEISRAPDVLLVPAAFPATTLGQLIEIAKAKPNSIIFGSAGLATPSSLETDLLMKITGTKLVAVPYTGGSEVILALLNGSVNMYFATISTALNNLSNGSLKALAVSSTTRAPQLPQVPTVAEVLHYPSFEGGTWLGVLAPAGTPKAVIDKLNDAFVYALGTKEVKDRLTALGWEVVGSTPAALGTLIRSDLARWAQVLQSK